MYIHNYENEKKRNYKSLYLRLVLQNVYGFKGFHFQ